MMKTIGLIGCVAATLLITSCGMSDIKDQLEKQVGQANVMVADMTFKSAIANLELHHKRNGSYPASLDDIEYGDNFIAGASYHLDYSQQGGGYVLDVKDTAAVRQLSYDAGFWNGLGIVGSNIMDSTVQITPTVEPSIRLGAFSLSLSVKDLAASKAFYEGLGFSSLGGDMSANYLIMKNENAIIGLFQGMFEGNIMTFNPGWNENGKDIASFDDIREIQAHLIEQGTLTEATIDVTTSGPASLVFTDPDGNQILMDQHR